jgi:23S rRNA pseudouridine1911/1915/1917 synthase
VSDPEIHRFVISLALAGERIDRALVALVPELTRTEAQRALAAGAVSLNGRPVARPAERLREGDEIRFQRPAPPPITLVPEPMPLDVRYEDEHLVVLVKPAGLVVHPGAGVRRGTLVAGLLARYGTLPGDPLRPGLVHRLDRDTTGLLVVARSPAGRHGLTAQVAARTMRRRYEAIVWGEPRQGSGTIEVPIGRSRRDRTRMAVRRTGGRVAITDYRVVEPLGIASRLEVDLKTGRTHQIRVHLQHLGHPVVGDPLYGGRPERLVQFPVAERERVRALLAALGRQALHAFQLGFVHPVTGEALLFEAARPPDLEAALAILRGESARPRGRGDRRLLGVDLGERRVGVALSDPEGRLATPLVQLEPRDERDLVDQLVDLAENEGVDGVVVGDPRHASGAASAGSAAAERLVERLGPRLGRPVWLWNEALTTFAAEQALSEAEGQRRAGSRPRSARARTERRARINQLAAALILQDFLDAHAGKVLPRPAAGPIG